MHDQRTARKMVIGSLDAQETNKLQKREERRKQLLSHESLTTFDPSIPIPSTSKSVMSGCIDKKMENRKLRQALTVM